MTAQALAALWGTAMGKLVTTAAGIGVLASCIIYSSQAWTKLEPYTWPTSGWVRSHIHDQIDSFKLKETDPIKVAQAQQSVAIDRFLLYQLQDTLDKARRDPAAQTSPIVQQRVKDLERQIMDTQIRLSKAPNG